MLKKGSGLALRTDKRGVGIAQFDQRLGYIWATEKCLSDFWQGYEISVFTKGINLPRVQKIVECV
jgi:hypothetical protein